MFGSNNWLWIIILLLFSNNGCGCEMNPCDGDNTWLIIILLLLSNNCNSCPGIGNTCPNNSGCGCGC